MSSPGSVRIAVATYEYRTPEGRRRRAYFGDRVTMAPEEVERAQRVGAVRLFEVAGQAVPASVPAESAGTDPGDISGGPRGPVPPKAGTKDLWIDYAVANGESPAAAEAMTKQDLITKYGGS